ncbi:MAG: class I SAM-dependent methyltransferase [Ferruginibacter sp.]
MAFYDNIAKRWHQATGYKGGKFKELVLNDILLGKISTIGNKAILELGAGNGYFLPLLLRRFSGEVPSGITVTDKSEPLLDICKRHFRIPGAQYQNIDVCKHLPYENDQFDLIIASMIFNEVPPSCFEKALEECRRVLSVNGLLLMTVIHPDFIRSLQTRKMLKSTKQGMMTMPATGSLRLPVVVRTMEHYQRSLAQTGFSFEETEVAPTKELLRQKAGLQKAAGVSIALVFTCTKTGL